MARYQTLAAEASIGDAVRPTHSMLMAYFTLTASRT
jgi:hypothetical protein